MGIWEVPRIPTPVPSWILSFAEAAGGVRLSSTDNLEVVPLEELDVASRKLEREPSNEFFEKLARWFLAEPGKRLDSPF